MSEQDNLPIKKQPKLQTTRIHVKLKKELKTELKKKAAENFISLSQLLLQSARTSTITIKRIAAPKNTKELLVMTAAYNKFGSQLNMIAKHCNTFKESSNSLKILSCLIDIEREIAQLKDELLGDL
ncbi:hypothetical protein [Pseudomonas salomonii]|nr:hypothetical protein [Pseudomonas salomonii]